MPKIILALVIAIGLAAPANAQLTVRELQAAFEAARSASERANNLDPSSVTLGWSAEQRGDYSEAIRQYKLGCNEGIRSYNNGDNDPRNRSNSDSCSYLGYLYEIGTGAPKDLHESAALYERALKINPDNHLAKTRLPIVRSPPVATPPHSQSAQTYRELCDAGMGGACYNLGHLYENGKGVPQNMFDASMLFEEACELGYMDGCASLGMMYLNGVGVNKNEVDGIKVIKYSCDRGSADGCLNMGVLFLNGQGVRKNQLTAVDYFRRALKIEPDNFRARQYLAEIGL